MLEVQVVGLLGDHLWRKKRRLCHVGLKLLGHLPVEEPVVNEDVVFKV